MATVVVVVARVVAIVVLVEAGCIGDFWDPARRVLSKKIATKTIALGFQDCGEYQKRDEP